MQVDTCQSEELHIDLLKQEMFVDFHVLGVSVDDPDVTIRGFAARVRVAGEASEAPTSASTTIPPKPS